MRQSEATGRRVGARHGAWTLLAHLSGKHWLARCDCGTEARVVIYNLEDGLSVRCKGCSSRSHGLTRTPEYLCWTNMLQRCENEKNPGYATYGGRGIAVCDRWRGEHGFESFLADMGPRPTPKHSLDRVNNDGNYEPGNCRWATVREQARNTSQNHVVTVGGVSATVAEWAERCGLKYSTISARLRRGWSPEMAVLR